MHICIATGIYPPQIGGPAQYALHLKEEFQKKGHTVSVRTYTIEHSLPMGIRQLSFFSKVVPAVFRSTHVLALDTLSVGIPAACAALLFRKKIVVRIGGDFLWEQYVERTKTPLTLPLFNAELLASKVILTFKEKIIYRLTRWLLNHVSFVVFSTKWQATIWKKSYNIKSEKIRIVENYMGKKEEGREPQRKNLVWAVRSIFLKNKTLVEEAFFEAKQRDPELILDQEIVPHDVFQEKLKKCYALLLPSLSEVSPNSILDALRYNKPCILTEETGYRELLKGAVTFVDPLKKEELIKAILDLSDPNTYREATSRAASFSKVRSWRMVADDFLSLYAQNE